MIKWVGAIFVLAACGGFGFQIAAMQRKETRTLRQLIGILDFAECELQYRLTPLPELCQKAAMECSGPLSTLFLRLGKELEEQISPNVSSCMRASIAVTEQLPKQTAEVLTQLGESLGKFDLNGQLRGLMSVREECNRRLHSLSENQDVRLRSYKTLGLCAGAALVILFI
jgi:stage III sporulation protein AB